MSNQSLRNMLSLRLLRHLLAALILTASVTITIRSFDWRMVTQALRQLNAGLLLGGGLPVLAAIFALRGSRWLIVLGIPFNHERFWRSFCANGTAAGLASLTPFQLGEIVKIRMIPDHHGSAWRLGVSGFFIERMLDLCGMLGLGLYGLMVHFGWQWMAPLALSLPLVGATCLSLLSSQIPRMPQRLRHYADALRHARRVVLAGALTIFIWLLYAGLWWIAVMSMHVALDFDRISLLLGSVMLAVIVSMTPGGLGVSELGSRGIMLWLGASTVDAETTAIAIRLLTPLIALAGLACLPPLLRGLRASPSANQPPASGR